MSATRLSTPSQKSPPGLLRLLALFHESQSLGAGTSVVRAVDELAAFGWSTSGWFPGNGTLPEVARERLARCFEAERPIAFSARGWREDPGPLGRLRAAPSYAGAVRAALLDVRPHVVHANTLLSLPEAAIARSCGLPIVLQLHEIPDPGLKRTAALRAAGRVADVIVAVSQAVADIARTHVGRTPVLIVRNGVPEAAPAPPARSRTAPFVVGTVGTVSLVKGTDVFLRAARIALEQRPHLRFEHVGAADLHRDDGLDEVLTRLHTTLPSGALTMLGSRPATNELRRWQVMVLPSRTEAFLLATLEAMATGIPVIASAVGGLPEQIEHERHGLLVPPDDPGALAAAIVRLHDDDALRSRIGETGAERVRREFTLAAQARGFHHAYLTALDLRFAPPQVRASVGAGS